MPEDFVASTQYGDMKGTVQFDGSDHFGPIPLELSRHLEMPAGYFPVGFGFGPSLANDQGVRFHVVAVKVEEYGSTVDEITKKATNGKLTVYRFDGRIKPEDFAKLVKRISLKVIAKALVHLDVTVEDGPEPE